MQPFAPFLFAAAAVAVVAAQITTDTPSPTISGAELAAEEATVEALPECSDPELNAAMMALTTDASVLLCEQTLGLASGELLQLTSVAEATAMCALPYCVGALESMYYALPNCRYEAWGLQHSAETILNYCAIDPTE